ncbi:tetraacyldisaccharide 4'-kinase [Litoreibacter roseus]|uniref:Tetraacyldisaccharide 4'-kinase n=1 Tax=Litoreibacter roseus TaxID=2601869 RepID=A0A6N6JLU4_9RHOB|nr:tetraacyldisaccharide 4'-kinase [Litoreibacter roseus]GFE66248.1 tetraacyldisaccharide 4'-kinase [Litoreibacter roseus]
MQAPRFWHRDKGLRATLLQPIGQVYAYATARRIATGTPLKLSIPVICVGNINVGGTGKTPTVIALCQRLLDKGHTPHVLSRGYGGSLKGPVLVDPQIHSAGDVGDEPLLLSAFAPTWVSDDRRAGAQMAVDAGAGVLVLDDGFQSPALVKDMSIVVVDAARGFGNGCVLPAGPLREPINVGLARADLVLSIGPPQTQTHFVRTWGGNIALPHATGHLEPLETGMPWTGLRVLAFAGIGHPQKFFATLSSLGADVVKSEALSDHQDLSPPLMERLQREAAAMNAQLVTTEKDAVRLPPASRQQVLTVPVRLELDDWSVLDGLMEKILP